jgi:hypothetical protein
MRPYEENRVRGIRYTRKLILFKLIIDKHETLLLVFTGITSVFLAEHHHGDGKM